MKRNETGFTLIELLIVIGIIAILASAIVIIIQPGEQFLRAREATRWSHVNSIVNAVYAYVATNQEWPDCVETSAAGDPDPVAVDVVTCTDIVSDTNTLPRDPTEGTAGGDTGYDLTAVLSGATIVSITVESSATESEVTITQ